MQFHNTIPEFSTLTTEFKSISRNPSFFGFQILAPLCPDGRQLYKNAKNNLFFWILFTAIVPKLVTLEIRLSNQTERTFSTLQRSKKEPSRILQLSRIFYLLQSSRTFWAMNFGQHGSTQRTMQLSFIKIGRSKQTKIYGALLYFPELQPLLF